MSKLLALHAKRPPRPTIASAEAVLGFLEEGLVWMAEAFGPGEATNGNRLASGRLPAVLEMALTNERVDALRPSVFYVASSVRADHHVVSDQPHHTRH